MRAFFLVRRIMDLTEGVLLRLSEAYLETFDDTFLNEKALSYVQKELKEEFEELNLDEVKLSRHNYFKVEDTSAESYGEFVLKLKNGAFIMMGIRHFGGNKELPFVKVLSTNSIQTKKEVLKIYREIEGYFKKFKPLWVSFDSKVERDVDFFGSVYMVSNADRYRNLPEYQSEQFIEFKNEADDSFYEWYERGYKDFHQEHPELEKKVSTNSKESFENQIKDGLVKSVYIAGERIGLISGERSPYFGQEGIYFHEIFIDQKFKGKGYAKVIQKMFVNQFAKPTDIIWGTIDYNNHASFKTAKSNGRFPTHFECFVSVM